MSALIVLAWQLTVVLLSVVAVVNVLCAGWWEVLTNKAEPLGIN